MSGGSGPRYLVYRLTLQSPLIVTSRQGDPNSAATQLFVPGSSIRGIVASRLLSAGVDPDSEEFRRLVLSGQVRYLNAYLEIEGERSLPIPISWRVLKGDPRVGRDLACFPGPAESAIEPEDSDGDWPTGQLEAPGAGFVKPHMEGGLWVMGQPRADARIHHQRDRQKGRAWKDREGHEHGAIFAYEFLEPEQSFRGVMQVMEDGCDCVDRLRDLLKAPVVIGRSRRAGYGGDVRVEFLRAIPREYAGATELLDHDVEPESRFRILLTSACIVRDRETGQVDPRALEAELCRRLGGGVQIERRRWAFEIVGGFNQKWGLELPQAWAVRAGSVFVVRALERLDFAKLLMLEHEGIGERRAEGFGRLIVLEQDDPHREIRLRRSEAQKTGHRQTQADNAADEQLLELLERRLVMEGALDELHRAAFELAAEVDKPPSKALLGQLRSLLRHAQDEARARAVLETLKGWIEQWKGSDQKAARQLKECRFKDKQNSLFEWLEALLTPDPSSRWEALRQAAGDEAALDVVSQKRCLRTPASTDRILQEHAAILAATFLDAVLGAISRKEVS